ncbi:MAG: urea ABC transporter permease subunit UrtB [Porticoccaceae bacterium]|nr:urea ABC transporter permease subunit UrtB [Porticoccaceae bacterium]HLS97683.1 urea ABC transporter permease subunit UrtB [Porticoccaceae bacterium]
MRNFLCCLLAMLALASPGLMAVETPLEAQLEQLAKASFGEKSSLLAAIAERGDDASLAILKAIQSGDLHYRKSDRKVVIVAKAEGGVALTDPVSNESLGIAGKRDTRKITINNSLRGELKQLIAGFKLKSPRPAERIQGAASIINDPSPDMLPVIDKALAEETDGDVREALDIARAAIIVSDRVSEPKARIAALAQLGEATDSNAINLVSKYTLKDAEGNYLEQDGELVATAEAALEKLKTRQSFYDLIQNLFFGVSLGSVLLLAAVGLAITFGVMGVINMAHGEMIMIGAYATYTVQLLMPNLIGASILVAIPVAFLVSGITGVLIERLIIRHLYGRPLETLLATFGLSLVLQQLVRTIYSPLNRSVITPEWMSGSWAVNGMLSLTWNRLYIIIFSLLVLFALIALMKKTSLGLQMRAVTLNRKMASSMGIKTGWIDAMTFGLGSGIAGIAGVALSQLTNVGPNLGQAYIIDSFMVVVFGGVGNLFGTLFAAMSLGIVNKFMEPLAGAVLAKILILVFIILFIQKWPRGLFAIKGRFIED